MVAAAEPVGAPVVHRERVLYGFKGARTARSRSAALVAGSSGALYGTTAYGGVTSGICGANGCGTVYKLAPNARGGYTKTTLYQFLGGSDGDTPLAGLLRDAGGALYGTTSADVNRRFLRLSRPRLSSLRGTCLLS